jgi:hypothetical protein
MGEGAARPALYTRRLEGATTPPPPHPISHYFHCASLTNLQPPTSRLCYMRYLPRHTTHDTIIDGPTPSLHLCALRLEESRS